MAVALSHLKDRTIAVFGLARSGLVSMTLKLSLIYCNGRFKDFEFCVNKEHVCWASYIAPLFF